MWSFKKPAVVEGKSEDIACRNCYCYDTVQSLAQGGNGRCKFNPPVVGEYCWPIVDPDEWCAKWRPTKEFWES